MKRYLDILNKELKRISLRVIERAEIRKNVVAYMRAHPFISPAVPKSPKVYTRAIPTPFFGMMRSMSFVSMIVIVTLVLGSGVSFAAESALPGDSLYPVKTNINENVQSFFALTDQSQAKLQVQFTTRRLEEAEQLAVQGRLTNSAKQQLGQNISEHTNGFKQQFSQLVSDKNYTSAIATASQFESTLKAHQNILTAIETSAETVGTSGAVATTTDATTSDATTTTAVADQVQASLAVARDARVIAENELNADSTPDLILTAENSLESAQEAIDETTAYLNTIKTEISTTSYSDLAAGVASSQQKVDLGKAKMSVSLYSQAFILFQDAERNADEAQVSLKTSTKLSLKTDNVIAISNGTFATSTATTTAPVACATNDDCSIGFVCPTDLSTGTTTASTTMAIATSTDATVTTTSDILPTTFCVPGTDSTDNANTAASTTATSTDDATATTTATS